jgi:hypothetical protein
LDRAQHAGLKLWTEGGTVQIEGLKPLPANLLAELRQHRAELAALLSGPSCYRCDAVRTRLVATYWTHWEQSLCPDCVADVVQEFDQHDTWPEFPVPDKPPALGETP